MPENTTTETWISVDQVVRRAAAAIHGSPAYGPASMRKARAATAAVMRELMRYFTAEAAEYRKPGAEQVIETYEAVIHDLLVAACEIEESTGEAVSR